MVCAKRISREVITKEAQLCFQIDFGLTFTFFKWFDWLRACILPPCQSIWTKLRILLYPFTSELGKNDMIVRYLRTRIAHHPPSAPSYIVSLFQKIVNEINIWGFIIYGHSAFTHMNGLSIKPLQLLTETMTYLVLLYSNPPPPTCVISNFQSVNIFICSTKPFHVRLLKKNLFSPNWWF